MDGSSSSFLRRLTGFKEELEIVTKVWEEVRDSGGEPDLFLIILLELLSGVTRGWSREK